MKTFQIHWFDKLSKTNLVLLNFQKRKLTNTITLHWPQQVCSGVYIFHTRYIFNAKTCNLFNKVNGKHWERFSNWRIHIDHYIFIFPFFLHKFKNCQQWIIEFNYSILSAKQVSTFCPPFDNIDYGECNNYFNIFRTLHRHRFRRERKIN